MTGQPQAPYEISDALRAQLIEDLKEFFAEKPGAPTEIVLDEEEGLALVSGLDHPYVVLRWPNHELLILVNDQADLVRIGDM